MENGNGRANDKHRNRLSIIPQFNLTDALATAIRVPGVWIDREQYLRKEFRKYYPKKTIELAIRETLAYAGIEKWSVIEIFFIRINIANSRVRASQTI